MLLEQIPILIVEALKFIFPAYCANAAPVIFGGGTPLDLDTKFLDGQPVFGRNKTFRGFFAGLILGSLVGIVEHTVFQQYPIFYGFFLALGALTGDLAGSFIKRRIGLSPGAPLPIIDQVDFVFGAFLFAFLFAFPSWEIFLAVLLLTLPIHFLTNVFAYILGMKDKPW
jgi:CDP-2,3-bis-(O-geranylgeranyl)-sn-glycerol synthase